MRAVLVIQRKWANDYGGGRACSISSQSYLLRDTTSRQYECGVDFIEPDVHLLHAHTHRAKPGVPGQYIGWLTGTKPNPYFDDIFPTMYHKYAFP